MLPAKRTKIYRMSTEEMGGKYGTNRPPSLILDRKKNMFSLMASDI